MAGCNSAGVRRCEDHLHQAVEAPQVQPPQHVQVWLRHPVHHHQPAWNDTLNHHRPNFTVNRLSFWRNCQISPSTDFLPPPPPTLFRITIRTSMSFFPHQHPRPASPLPLRRLYSLVSAVSAESCAGALRDFRPVDACAAAFRDWRN